MPHYAELNSNSVVKRIIFVNEADTDNFSGAEDETVGSSILQSLHGENTIWKKCSTLGEDIDSRGYCNLGLVYNEEHDKFITPSPYSSWTLNSSLQWVAPVEVPSLTEEQIEQGYENKWDEESLSWKLELGTDAVVTVTVQPSDTTVSVGSSATFDTGATVTKGEFKIYLEKEGDDGWKIVEDTETEGNSIHTGILDSTDASGNYRIVYEPLESGFVSHSNTLALTVNE
jgi:hypothetical protein